MSQTHHIHGPHCGCLDRRKLFGFAATGLTALALPLGAKAGGHAEAVVLNCMDYRLVDEGVRYFNFRGLKNNYDQLILAGGSIGALGMLGPEWSATFWKHVETAIALHKVQKVIVMDHRDCGAYKLVFGADSIAEKDLETALHRSQMTLLREQVSQRFPTLKSEGLIMNLDGSVENLFPAEGVRADYKPPRPKPKAPAQQSAGAPGHAQASLESHAPAQPHAPASGHGGHAPAAPRVDIPANAPIETAAPPPAAAPQAASHATPAHAPAPVHAPAPAPHAPSAASVGSHAAPVHGH